MRVSPRAYCKTLNGFSRHRTASGGTRHQRSDRYNCPLGDGLLSDDDVVDDVDYDVDVRVHKCRLKDTCTGIMSCLAVINPLVDWWRPRCPVRGSVRVLRERERERERGRGRDTIGRDRGMERYI